MSDTLSDDPVTQALELIANGASYREAAEKVGKHRSWLWRRLASADPELQSRYARAREFQAHADYDKLDAIIGELLDVARSGQADNAVVMAYRTAADQLRWGMARKHPKVYGDKLEVEQKRDVQVTVLLGRPEPIAGVITAEGDPKPTLPPQAEKGAPRGQGGDE